MNTTLPRSRLKETGVLYGWSQKQNWGLPSCLTRYTWYYRFLFYPFVGRCFQANLDKSSFCISQRQGFWFHGGMLALDVFWKVNNMPGCLRPQHAMTIRRVSAGVLKELKEKMRDFQRDLAQRMVRLVYIGHLNHPIYTNIYQSDRTLLYKPVYFWLVIWLFWYILVTRDLFFKTARNAQAMKMEALHRPGRDDSFLKSVGSDPQVTTSVESPQKNNEQ